MSRTVVVEPAGEASARAAAWARVMPMVFVLIWSTGFVGARYGMPHSPPFTFLAWRYLLSVLCFLPWIALAQAAWPVSRAQWRHLAVTGVLMHAGYLGGVWAAVRLGMGAGTAALIVGLQPVLTALWISAASRGGQVSVRQWMGLLLGLAGLVLVVWHRLGAGEVNSANLMLAVGALASITTGTLYQKRFVQPCDVRTANTVQLLAALAVTVPLALLETDPMVLHPELTGAMAWSVFILTLGGSSLMYLLIQRGAATQVTSLLYLVPPCTAVLAWWLFDEALTTAAMIGVALTVAGVLLVVRERPAGSR